MRALGRCVAVLLLASAAAAGAQTAPSLAGLWAARRDFGPDVRGALRLADGRAEIAGRSAPFRVDHGAVTFELPNGEGKFRGAIRGDRIDGHWIQNATVATGREFATPVTLRKTTAGWAGEVRPLADHITLFLSVTPNGAFLRNPERNLGRFLAVESVAIEGSRVTLLGKDKTVSASGTYLADDDVLSISLPSAGGTFDFHRATAADEAMFYPRGKTPAPYVYRKPVERDDGWRVGTVDEAGISRDGIAKLIDRIVSTPIDSVHASDIHDVLIARHGKLVLEEYFHGTSADEPHDTRSAAKSLTSILAGAAKVPVSTKVYAAMHYPTDDPRKRAMSLENLLMQNSGLDCDDDDDKSPGNENVMQEQTAQPDWYAYTLALKNIRPPGETSVYCSCQPNLAGGVLARETGRWLPDLFRELVAEPMQMRDYAMILTPTEDAYMGGGVRLMPRDFLKLAQLIMDGGSWRGRQVVSGAWAKQSVSPLTAIGDRKYGYLWWLQDYPYKGRTVRAFYAAGNGGQIAVAIPELDLAITFNGGNYSDRVALLPGNVLIPESVLPAVN